jgi:TRAP-type C4-dicarboxylate transport system substrate-binding protein
MWAETFSSLGAVPTTIQWAEVYSALEQGVVDAAEAPLSTIYTSRLHETARYLTLTSHFVGITGAQMSERIWQTLTPEQQRILTEEYERQGLIYSQGVVDSVADFRNRLSAEGVTVIEVDPSPFATASRATFDRFPDWTPGLFERVRRYF